MTLNIQVNSDFRITSDNYNVIVNRKHVVDPTKSPGWKRMELAGADPSTRVSWKEVAYFPRLGSALSWIVDQSIRESDSTDIEELRDDINTVKEEIKNAITSYRLEDSNGR